MNNLGYTLAVSAMQRVLPRRKRKENIKKKNARPSGRHKRHVPIPTRRLFPILVACLERQNAKTHAGRFCSYGVHNRVGSERYKPDSKKTSFSLIVLCFHRGVLRRERESE